MYSYTTMKSYQDDQSCQFNKHQYHHEMHILNFQVCGKKKENNSWPTTHFNNHDVNFAKFFFHHIEAFSILPLKHLVYIEIKQAYLT